MIKYEVKKGAEKHVHLEIVKAEFDKETAEPKFKSFAQTFTQKEFFNFLENPNGHTIVRVLHLPDGCPTVEELQKKAKTDKKARRVNVKPLRPGRFESRYDMGGDSDAEAKAAAEAKEKAEKEEKEAAEKAGKEAADLKAKEDADAKAKAEAEANAKGAEGAKGKPGDPGVNGDDDNTVEIELKDMSSMNRAALDAYAKEFDLDPTEYSNMTLLKEAIEAEIEKLGE